VNDARLVEGRNERFVDVPFKDGKVVSEHLRIGETKVVLGPPQLGIAS